MSKRSLPAQGRPPIKRPTPNTPKATLDIPTQQHQLQQQPLPAEQQISKAQQEFDSATSKTWISIGQCAVVFQLYPLAVQAYESSLRHTPDNAESLIGFSKALKLHDIAVGVKQSTELLLSSIQRFPHLSNEFSIWKELAETHLSSNQYEEAHQAISRALSLNNNDPDCLLIGAESLIKLANFQHATITLHSVVQSFSSKTHLNEHEVEILRKSHFKLAQLAALENNLKLATSEMKSALSLPPPPPSKINDQASLWAFLITIRERVGDLEDALKVAQDSIGLLGHLPKLLIANAYILLLPNTKYFEPNVAINLLESAINQEKLSKGPEKDEDFLVWYLLGKAHSAVDQPREAYDAFQIALRIGPSSPLPWLAVGSLYLRMGQLPDALAAYSQAARLLVDDNSIPSAAASAAAWDGLSCVYERCDDQAHDAADACLRASSCFRAAGDLRAASQFEQRAHSLTAASRGQAPVPTLRGPPGAPLALLRELVVSGSGIGENVPLNQQQQSQQPQQTQQQIQPQSQGSPLINQVQQAPPPPHQQLQPGPQLLHQQGPSHQGQHRPLQHTPQQPAPQQTPRIPGGTPKQFHHLPLPRGSLVSRSRSNTPDISSKTIENPENSRQVPAWSPVQPSTQQPPPQGQLPQEGQGQPTSGSTYYFNGPSSRSILISNPPNGSGPEPHAPHSASDVHHSQLPHPSQQNTPQVVQGPILVQHNYPPQGPGSVPAAPGAQQGYLPPPGFSFANGGPQPTNAPYVPWR